MHSLKQKRIEHFELGIMFTNTLCRVADPVVVNDRIRFIRRFRSVFFTVGRGLIPVIINPGGRQGRGDTDNPLTQLK